MNGSACCYNYSTQEFSPRFHTRVSQAALPAWQGAEGFVCFNIYDINYGEIVSRNQILTGLFPSFGDCRISNAGAASRAGRASPRHHAGSPGNQRGASPSRRAGIQHQAGSFPGAIAEQDVCLGQGTKTTVLQHLESHSCGRRCCLSFPSAFPISSHLPMVRVQLLSLSVRKTRSEQT